MSAAVLPGDRLLRPSLKHLADVSSEHTLGVRASSKKRCRLRTAGLSSVGIKVLVKRLGPKCTWLITRTCPGNLDLLVIPVSARWTNGDWPIRLHCLR